MRDTLTDIAFPREQLIFEVIPTRPEGAEVRRELTHFVEKINQLNEDISEEQKMEIRLAVTWFNADVFNLAQFKARLEEIYGQIINR